VAPNRIVTTCPHCLHTLKNEYPDYGGHYTVIHHTELLAELLEAGRLKLQDGGWSGTLSFHDPCYLGRQGGITEAPRAVLRAAGIRITEMPRNKARSFCCGAGGAQMWKEEEDGELRVSSARVLEAQTTGAQTLAVGCPFCNIMLHDAAVAEGEVVRVRDVAEILAERLNPLKR
jgi:Fe-S oxidoreductase